MADFDVIVIGGGLSGLSAAVELSLHNFRVLLLEQHRYCGGRSASHWDERMECDVDNGQHLMMGCYHATRHYIGTIGSEHLTYLQPNLHIKFLRVNQDQVDLRCPALLPPFHLLLGLLDFSVLPWKDRINTLRVALEIIRSSSQKENTLDLITVDEWLTSLQQSSLNRQYLWDVITIGALNNYPKDVSAVMLFRVLRAAFLGKRQNASLLMPKVGLSKLFVDPAIRFIESRGGRVQTDCGVNKVLLRGMRIQAVQTRDKKKYSASSFISAVPWFDAENIFPNLFQERINTHFRSSPIIAIHLWFDRHITELDFAALIGTNVQWLFNKSIFGQAGEQSKKKNVQYLTLVMSGAKGYIGMDKMQLVKIAKTDLFAILPEVRYAKIVHSVVIKEKRATFSPVPGLEKIRPTTQTKYGNLFLAGDWTATGYPATIEGAVLSGKNAARLVLEQQS